MIIQRMLIFRGIVALCLWSALAGCENMDTVTQPSTETPSGAQADTGTSNGGERLIASHQGLSATVPKNFSCADSVQVTVHAPDETAFTGDRIKLQRLIGGVRGKFGFDCPQVRNLMIVGRADGREIYRGIISDKNNWVLVDIQPPVLAGNPPPAVAYVRDPPPSVSEATPAPAPTTRAATGVTECDRLAAHPSDPDAVSAGVSDEQIDALSVIAACEAAVRTDPTPRLQFQLARGYLKADRIEDAIEQFVAAAEQGHGGALAYLGDFHLEGVPGIEADPILARSLYQRAVEAGFAPAKAVLDQFEDYTEQFAQVEREEQIAGKAKTTSSGQGDDGYHSSAIVNAIYDRNYSAVPDDQETRRYVVSILRAFAENCGDRPGNVALAAPRYASPEYRQMEKNPLKVFEFGLKPLVELRRGGMPAFEGMANQMAMFREEGIQDGVIFIQTYGCQGKESFKFQNNLHALILERSHKEPDPRSDGRHDNLEQACLVALGNRPAHSRSPERFRRQYCGCAAPRLEGSLTPAERDMLLQDFNQLGRLMQQQRRDLLPYVGQCNI